MTVEAERPQDWTVQQERGSAFVMRATVWLALHLGRRAMRWLLPPACLYYLLAAPETRAASRDYLARVLDHAPGWRDSFRQFHAFASVVLDRIFLLNDQNRLFDIEIQGEVIVRGLATAHEGCLLFGAHLGSFEVLRAVGRAQANLKVSMVMYEDNARKTNAALNAINPDLALDVIALGRSHSLITVGQRLADGHFCGVLADRSPGCDEMRALPFLGDMAAFPEGPFRMAMLLKHPVILMFGLYRGGNRYEIHFESLACTTLEETMQRYVARLEHYCRQAPYNWFNFYRFWG
jgi:predicted LPLAT superfamily acyltransferase